MNPDKVLPLLALASAIVGGRLTPEDVARRLVGIAVDLIPVDTLRGYLTEEAAVRDMRIVDAIEDVKFGAK